MAGRSYEPQTVRVEGIGDGLQLEFSRNWVDANDGSGLREVDATDWRLSYQGRPLVVLDPENRGQIEHFHRVLFDSHDGDRDSLGYSHTQAALRSLAERKPQEPTGRYAVVVDSAGDEWIRDGLTKDHACTGVWWSATRAKSAHPDSWRADWDAIPVVEVVFEGVSA
jgi:hypothetical protein